MQPDRKNAMQIKKLLALAGIVILAASCTRTKYIRTDNWSYIGLEEGELVFRLGPPDQIYELGKEKYLTYIKVALGYGNMGGYAPNFCKLTFVLYKEKVDNWHYEGNLCDQYIESINLQ